MPRRPTQKTSRSLGLVVLVVLGSLLLNACARSDALSYQRIEEIEGDADEQTGGEGGLFAFPGMPGAEAGDPSDPGATGEDPATPGTPGGSGSPEGAQGGTAPGVAGASSQPVAPDGSGGELPPGFETATGTPYAVPPQQSGGQQYQPVFAEVSMDGGMFDQQTLLMMTTMGIAKLEFIAGKQVYVLDMAAIPGQPAPEGVDPNTSIVLLWPKGSTVVMGTGAPRAILVDTMGKIIRGEISLQS